MSNWTRPYYQESDLRPYLFFAAFCDIDPESLSYPGSLSRGLEVRAVDANFFREGPLWEQVQAEQPELAEKILGSPRAFVVQGTIENPQQLDYLRKAIDFLCFLLDEGACAVYDPQTLRWWTPRAFDTQATEGQIFNPFDHVILLSSEEDGGQWLHTRGMRKFGRPDLSVHRVADHESHVVKKLLDRFINYQALGGLIEEGRLVKMEGLEIEFRPGPLQGDPEDPDFNNFHVELLRT